MRILCSVIKGLRCSQATSGGCGGEDRLGWESGGPGEQSWGLDPGGERGGRRCGWIQERLRAEQTVWQVYQMWEGGEDGSAAVEMERGNVR